MHKLRKFYYDNKEKIWGIIIFVVLVLLSIQIVNKLMSIQNLARKILLLPQCFPQPFQLPFQFF